MDRSEFVVSDDETIVNKKLSELRFRCSRCKATTDHHATVIVLPRNF